MSLDNIIHNLIENNIIEHNFEFLNSLEKGAKWIYNVVTDYEKTEIINLISDLSDADGFGSQIVLDKGIEVILKYLGNEEKLINSTRISNFSKDTKSPNNLVNLIKKLGGEKTIICDLATLDPKTANKTLKDLLFIEHHKPKTGFNPDFTIINPHLNNINGSKELSASMISTLVINKVYDMLEENLLKEERKSKDVKKQKEELKKLRKQLDTLTILGIAGSSADMQENVNHNKILYNYALNKGILKEIDCPFYGYSTKPIKKVWAEFTPNYNLKYDVISIDNLNKIFTNNFKNIPQDRQEIIKQLYTKFRWAFVDNKKEILFNIQYINSLTNQEIDKLNNYIKKLTQSYALEINYSDGQRDIKILEGFKDSGFNHFTDDEIIQDKRVEKTAKLTRKLNANPETTLSKENNDFLYKLKMKYLDNLTAFGNPNKLEWNLEQLKKKEYISTLKNDLLNNLSISEIGNCMTAMSKLECGNIFMNALDEILYFNEITTNKIKQKNVETVHRMWNKYKIFTAKSMKKLEHMILTGNGLKQFGNIFFLDVDCLSELTDEIKPEKINGVCGKIIANKNLLPTGDGILFTSVNIYETLNNKKYPFYKISGRATDGPFTQYLKINEFMEMFKGGGHGPAAACKIHTDKLPVFLEKMQKFDFYNGKIKK